MIYLFGYLILINMMSFFLFGLDKKRAEKKKWRIKESSLLFFSLIGGGIGSLIGMRIFRHKTQKNKFKFGVPLLTIISIGIIFLIVTNYIV